MVRISFILIILGVFSVRNGAAGQSVQQVVDFSVAEYDSGNYAAAARDFQRAWLFCHDSLKPVLEQRIGDCFYNLDEFDQASGFYNSALQKANDDSSRCSILMDIASCHIRSGEFFTALSDLEDICTRDKRFFEQQRWYLRGICNWGINRYDEAFNCFVRSMPVNNLEANERIRSLQSEFSAIRYPSIRLAGWLSILPGAGQFYCGEWVSGLNSLILNGSLMLAGYFSVVIFKNNILLLNLLPWLERYYTGGIVHARGYAERKLLERKNRVFESIIDIVTEARESGQSSLSPANLNSRQLIE